jgi:hypothetical protein
VDLNEHEKAMMARLKKAGAAIELTSTNSTREELDAFETLYRDGIVGCADIAKAPSPGARRVVHVFGAYLVQSQKSRGDRGDDHWYKKPVGIVVLGVTVGLLLLLIKFLLGF